MRITRRHLLTRALALTAVAPPVNRGAEMTRLAEEFRTKYSVPGLSIAASYRGELVYEEAFGLADLEHSERLTPAHLFRVASVSKPITAVAIMDLVESGRLRLDDRVFGRGGVLATDYGHPPYGRYLEDITIQHLLTHTAGGWGNEQNDPASAYPRLDRTRFISQVLDTRPLDTAPGEHYAYSNFGFILLGRVIEVVTGTFYDEHVKQRVLRRCGITGMSIGGDTLAERQPREVRYYGQDGDPYHFPVARSDSAAGWIATPRDLVMFVNHVDGLNTMQNILRADTIARMTKPSAANPNYALGWAVNSNNIWWHAGSLIGTRTIILRTSTGFCWAALVNTRQKDWRSELLGDALANLIWYMLRAGGWRP
ncbi:MAG TPA: serine hydrolase domain-containing protein [Vicinamibacterales bacterium]|nr:serine hydrolase domain-containing protein [Vicinamibacterales bacterium]